MIDLLSAFDLLQYFLNVLDRHVKLGRSLTRDMIMVVRSFGNEKVQLKRTSSKHQKYSNTMNNNGWSPRWYFSAVA